MAHSAELVLAADGKSDYQIIVPDASPSPALAEAPNQTASLVQAASQANGFKVPVVAEVPPTRLKFGQANTVAVRVHNSTGNGGIWRPVLVQALPAR